MMPSSILIKPLKNREKPKTHLPARASSMPAPLNMSSHTVGEMLRLLLCKDVVFGMVYYKVPPSLQDAPCYRPNVSPRIPNGYYLIANELLTLSECRHINAPIEKLEKVTMKKTDAYHMFGARFACND